MNRVGHLSIPLLTLLIASCAPGSPDPQRPKGLFVQGDPAAEQLASELAESWLEEAANPALAGVEDFFLRQVVVDDLGMAHVRVQQTQGGVPVFGGEGVVHLQPDGSTTFTDALVHGLRVDPVPALTVDDAVDAALYLHGGGVSGVDADLQVLPAGAFRSAGADPAAGDRLTWRVQIDDFESAVPSRPVIFVDAHTGDEVWRYDNLQTAKNRNTYSSNNTSSLPGTLRRVEGNPDVGDVPIDSAHNYAGTTYDYYFNVQGRDSYDDAGALLKSSAHYSVNYDNAYWNGTQMVYGDGGTYFWPLSQALDVVGHELTHAVTEHSANLVYSGESGGLNEATSDILGATIEAYAAGWTVNADTWKIGEDIAKHSSLGGALRFMDNPPQDGASIDNYGDYYAGLDVHYSSGIANKAFYLMEQDAALDIQGAGNIWYRALTLYMTSTTTFSQARDATIDAATDLYGAGSAQVTAVGAAWDAVGVTAPLEYVVFDTRSNLGASSGTQTQYQFATPAGATAMQFQISGGTGDADLYVRFGSAPTTSTYDCRPYLNGNAETCTFNPSQSGTYYVMVHAYSTYSGVTLTAASAGGSAPPPPPPPPAEVCTDGIDNDLDGDTDCVDSDCSADPACAVACPGGTFQGTLSSTNTSDEYADAVARSGLFSATLTGDAGTDFDLYLEYKSGNRWKTRASSLGSTSDEAINYNEGSVVLHRWKVKRWSGTGNYTLCVQ